MRWLYDEPCTGLVYGEVEQFDMPERVKAGKFAINGVSLAPIEKTVENGRKIIAVRTEKTVAAISKAKEAAKIAP